MSNWIVTTGKVKFGSLEVETRGHKLDIDFGFTDEKGRAVGCYAFIRETDAIPAGVYTDFRGQPNAATMRRIESHVQATRDGKKFGALAPVAHHDTLEGAKLSVLARAEQSRKRQARRLRKGKATS